MKDKEISFSTNLTDDKRVKFLCSVLEKGGIRLSDLDIAIAGKARLK